MPIIENVDTRLDPWALGNRQPGSAGNHIAEDLSDPRVAISEGIGKHIRADRQGVGAFEDG
jgi:hypothetical protein